MKMDRDIKVALIAWAPRVPGNPSILRGWFRITCFQIVNDQNVAGWSWKSINLNSNRIFTNFLSMKKDSKYIKTKQSKHAVNPWPITVNILFTLNLAWRLSLFITMSSAKKMVHPYIFSTHKNGVIGKKIPHNLSCFLHLPLPTQCSRVLETDS